MNSTAGSVEQARELVAKMGELDEGMVGWVLARLANDHNIKIAWWDRETVSHELSRVLSDAEWARLEATWEWRNLEGYMMDGAASGVNFAIQNEDVLDKESA